MQIFWHSPTNILHTHTVFTQSGNHCIKMIVLPNSKMEVYEVNTTY